MNIVVGSDWQAVRLAAVATAGESALSALVGMMLAFVVWREGNVVADLCSHTQIPQAQTHRVCTIAYTFNTQSQQHQQQQQPDRRKTNTKSATRNLLFPIPFTLHQPEHLKYTRTLHYI